MNPCKTCAAKCEAFDPTDESACPSYTAPIPEGDDDIWRVHASNATPVTGHDLFETGDSDAPDHIKDRNGEVVLDLCRRCGKGESELVPAAPVAQGSSWLIAADLAENNAAIREALEAFAADKTGDNAAGIVAAVLDTAPTPSAPVSDKRIAVIAADRDYWREQAMKGVATAALVALLSESLAKLICEPGSTRYRDDARAALAATFPGATPADPVAPAGYLEGVNVPRLILALSRMGCATEGLEATAAVLADSINRLTRAVVRPDPAAPGPLTDEQVFADEVFMGLNASLGLSMDQIMALVRCVERAHGVTRKGGAA